MQMREETKMTTRQDGEHGYVAFYNGRETDVYAKTSYEAYTKAVDLFKPPKSKKHMVHVHLAEKAA